MLECDEVGGGNVGALPLLASGELYEEKPAFVGEPAKSSFAKPQMELEGALRVGGGTRTGSVEKSECHVGCAGPPGDGVAHMSAGALEPQFGSDGEPHDALRGRSGSSHCGALPLLPLAGGGGACRAEAMAVALAMVLEQYGQFVGD